MGDMVIDDAILQAAKELVDINPKIGRVEAAKALGVTDYKARRAIEAARTEPIGPRIAYFDLETTDLIADFGIILIGSILSYPSMEMTTYRIDQTDTLKSEDYNISKLIRDKLEEHHITCGYYSKGFDIAFLNTRLVQNGHRKLKRHLHFDPIWYYRGWRGLKPRSSKMSVVAEYYGFEERKQKVDISVWRRASRGDSAALDELVERCESDVRITARIAERTFENDLIANIQKYP